MFSGNSDKEDDEGAEEDGSGFGPVSLTNEAN